MPNNTSTLLSSKNINNSTETAKYRPSYTVASQSYWITTFIADSIIVICNVWIAFAFVSHSYDVLSRHRIDKHNRRVYKSLMVAVVVPFTRYFSTFALLMVMTDPSDMACEIAIDVGKSFFILSVVGIYMFYWTRQRSFYQNSALSNTVSNKVKIASKMSLFQLLTLAFLTIPLAVYPDEYAAYPGGCIAKGGHVTKNGRYYGYAIVLLLAQVTMLALFSYPLVQHYKAQRRRKKQSNLSNVSTAARIDVVEAQHISALVSTEQVEVMPTDESVESADDIDARELTADIMRPIQTNLSETPEHVVSLASEQDHIIATTRAIHSGKNACALPPSRIRRTVRKLPATLRKRLSSVENNDKLYVIIKRTFKLSALAVFSDMVTLFVTGDILPEDTPQCLVRLVYDVDLFINVIAVIAGFEDWRKILKTPADRLIRINGA